MYILLLLLLIKQKQMSYMLFTFLEFKLLKEDLITKSFLKNFLKKKIIIFKKF